MNEYSQQITNLSGSSRLDEEFVSYLLNKLEECLSLSQVPPPCPYCNKPDAYLAKRGGNASSELPKFRCETCNRMFTRLSGSAFSYINRRELLPGFIQRLPQQKSYRSAGQELGCEWRLLWRWTVKLQKWLLAQSCAMQLAGCIRLGQETTSVGGFKKRPPIAPLESEILRLRLEGHAIGAIATRLELNHATVAKVIRHYKGLSAGEVPPARRTPGRPPKIIYSNEVIREVEKRRSEGQRLTEIALELDLLYEPLARQCRRERKKRFIVIKPDER